MNTLIILAAYVPLALLRGWVISLLWGWYVSDYFGLARLTVVEAVGLGLLVSLFTASRPSEEPSPWTDLLYVVSFTLLGLAFGWAWSFAR